MSKIALKVNAVLDIIRRRFTVGMWEAHKVLILQYGIVMMLIMFIASKSLGFQVWPLIPVSAAELLLGMGAGKRWYVVPLIAWLIIGSGALIVYNRKWSES